MGNVNIPSYNALLPKERRIRSIQELYEAVKELQAGGSSELSARVEALESLVSEGDNPTLAIDKFNEILDFLDGYDNTDSLVNLLTGKQDVIDSSHKLSADLVDDANTTNKFTNATEKQTWNGKQDALTFNTAPSSNNKVATMADVPSVPNNLVCFSNDSGDGIVPTDGIRGEDIVASSAISVNPDVVTAITGEIGSATTITLVAPNDNLRHVWDMFFTTASNGSATIVVPQGVTLHVPSGYSIASGKTYEIRIIGVGSHYYLSYGEYN